MGVREGGVTPATVRVSLGRLWRLFTTFEWCVIAVVGLLVLAGLYAGTMRLVPYEPYTNYDYDVIPDYACEGDAVRVETEREIDPDYYVAFLDYESRWVETGESVEARGGVAPLVVGSESGRLDAPPPARERIQSPVVRGVPFAGEWVLVNEIDAVGSIGGVRRTQEVEIRTDEPLRVMEAGAELPDGREC